MKFRPLKTYWNFSLKWLEHKQNYIISAKRSYFRCISKVWNGSKNRQKTWVNKITKKLFLFDIYWLFINRMWGLYGKVFAWSFRRDRTRKERSLCRKNRGQIFFRSNQTNEVNKEFIIWLLVPAFIAFYELFPSFVCGLLACFFVLLRVFCVNSSSFLLKIIVETI